MNKNLTKAAKIILDVSKKVKPEHSQQLVKALKLIAKYTVENVENLKNLTGTIQREK